MTEQDDQLVPVKVVARILGVSPSTVLRWEESVADFPKRVKDLPGKTRRWKLSAVYAYMNRS